jgi:hypothetical protein
VSTGGQGNRHSEEYSTLVPVRGYASGTVAVKPALNALLGMPEVSSTDLLDVYTELIEVASELQGLVSEDRSFGHAESSTELA